MAPKTQKQNEATWIFAAKRILPKQNKTKIPFTNKLKKKYPLGIKNKWLITSLQESQIMKKYC